MSTEVLYILLQTSFENVICFSKVLPKQTACLETLSVIIFIGNIYAS